MLDLLYSNYVYYTDLPPRCHSDSSLQITKMDEKQLQQKVTQKSKSEAQTKKEATKSSEQTKSRAKEKPGKAIKLQLKREKKHFAVVDQEPIVEMLAEDKKDRVKQLTVRTENWCSKGYQDDRTTLKPSRITSTQVLNRTMSALSTKVSEARISAGQQKRKPFLRDKISESAVQGNLNTIRVNVSESQYVCGSGLPDQSYLNITSKQFWN